MAQRKYQSGRGSAFRLVGSALEPSAAGPMMIASASTIAPTEIANTTSRQAASGQKRNALLVQKLLVLLFIGGWIHHMTVARRLRDPVVHHEVQMHGHEYAGRVGDGRIVTGGKDAELYRDQLLPAFEDGARESGRDPSRLDKMIEVKVSFDSDRQRALEDTRYWGALALSAQEKVGVEDPIAMERLADALPAERTATRWIVSTDPEEHVQQIRFYTDLGFNHLVFHAPGPDQRRFLDLYAERVMPLLRKNSRHGLIATWTD
jgi:Luciferase-like monooxygenase